MEPQLSMALGANNAYGGMAVGIFLAYLDFRIHQVRKILEE